MNVVSKQNYNTNNAWGFGGGIGVKTIFDNGVEHKKGRAYYRHLPDHAYQRWDVNVGDLEYPDFTVEVHGKKGKSDKIFVYRKDGSYRAYFKEKKYPFPYYAKDDQGELFKVVDLTLN